jgi:hypothetical protein
MRKVPIDDDAAANAGPSGATDKLQERETKFDEEGGDQPQAKSEHEVADELRKAREGEEKARGDH